MAAPDTKARIMAAALEEFAEHGVSGARVDRIARNAKANKESIYRYYGLKEELLDQVLGEYLRTNGDNVSPEANALDEYVAGLFRHYQHDPRYLRLCLWEGMERVGLRENPALAERRAHFAEKLEAVRSSQADGTVDPGLDPRHLTIVLLGMVNYWFAVPQIVELLFGREPDAEILAEHERFLAECARRIVAPREPLTN
ncbi:TetR family transcriptional regulator [Streptomyces sp. DSM 44917]|uniref:TetR family transcriptional regulator n=1 Tax=Streptomyces boetiae TaxID=3075541 RepID=A0ABU2LEJ3_9ACTN|nr:TetR family transcriptional regulator [Streptomyces sp. DSM 44917]MDT0309593.1 TetR family transcriptional regulator [Streptomyces sp. DSM 44917]